MEEIDIIELLKRVKEGKAPKKIQVNNLEYEFLSNKGGYYREVIDCTAWIALTTDFNLFDLVTKIKILDKPIIPELPKINENEYDTNSSYRSLVAYENRYVINEIIRRINKEGK